VDCETPEQAVGGGGMMKTYEAFISITDAFLDRHDSRSMFRIFPRLASQACASLMRSAVAEKAFPDPSERDANFIVQPDGKNRLRVKLIIGDIPQYVPGPREAG